MDHALGQLALEVSSQVLDLVVEGAANFPEVVRQPVAHRQVQVSDSLEAEAVVDSLFVSLADHVQVAERVADRLELARLHARGREHLAFLVLEQRHAAVVEVAIEAAHPILHRMRARERVLAQKRQQIDLALQLVLAFDLVDPQQKFALGGFST